MSRTYIDAGNSLDGSTKGGSSGTGVRLFDGLGAMELKIEPTGVLPSAAVPHLNLRLLH